MDKKLLLIAGIAMLLFLVGCTNFGGQAVGGKSASSTITPASGPREPLPPICSDGTPAGQCSKNKPFYCAGGSGLVPSCSQCGCDANYTCDANTQACVSLMPDFVVKDLNADVNANLIPGRFDIRFRLTIQNIGNARFDGVRLNHLVVKTVGSPNFYPNNVGFSDNPHYAPGEAHQLLSAVLYYEPNGYYKFLATADSNNDANESNESNNSQSFEFTIGTPTQIDFNAGGIVPTDLNNVDSNISFRMFVSNTGTQGYQGLLNHSMDIYRTNGQPVISRSINASNQNYAPGSTFQYDGSFTGLVAGSYYAQENVDTSESVFESNENNNQARYYFTLP